jgi:hypothetical protein
MVTLSLQNDAFRLATYCVSDGTFVYVSSMNGANGQVSKINPTTGAVVATKLYGLSSPNTPSAIALTTYLGATYLIVLGTQMAFIDVATLTSSTPGPADSSSSTYGGEYCGDYKQAAAAGFTAATMSALFLAKSGAMGSYIPGSVATTGTYDGQKADPVEGGIGRILARGKHVYMLGKRGKCSYGTMGLWTDPTNSFTYSRLNWVSDFTLEGVSELRDAKIDGTVFDHTSTPTTMSVLCGGRGLVSTYSLAVLSAPVRTGRRYWGPGGGPAVLLDPAMTWAAGKGEVSIFGAPYWYKVTGACYISGTAPRRYCLLHGDDSRITIAETSATEAAVTVSTGTSYVAN